MSTPNLSLLRGIPFQEWRNYAVNEIIAQHDGFSWHSFYRVEREKSSPKHAGKGKNKGDFECLSSSSHWEDTEVPNYFEEIEVIRKFIFRKIQGMRNKERKKKFREEFDFWLSIRAKSRKQYVFEVPASEWCIAFILTLYIDKV